MTNDYQQLIQSHCHPLTPEPTAVAKRIDRLPDIRAVLFDVYGTMIISASGDVGANVDAAKTNAMSAALESIALQLPCSVDECFRRFVDMIRTHQARARDDGTAHPEVDIVAVWRELLTDVAGEEQAAEVDCQRLAIEYEVRVNPTWPMPGLVDCLARLRADRSLGIISNAQFFTLELFPALVGENVTDLGFATDLQFYSYRYGQAKPGTELYEMAARALEQREILPAQVLYVGNDMLNDIRAASMVGFCTALFAGDARSLRLREDDSRVAGLTPDVIITELADLADCV